MTEGPNVLAGLVDVSHETQARLAAFERLLRQWQRKTNLVGSDTLDRFWTHHVADGAFLYREGGDIAHWTDIGAGAGLPGLILAILSAGDERTVGVDLVESTGKKCAFQRAVMLHTGLRDSSATVGIHNKRIEAFEAASGSVLTARALAPLPELIAYMQKLKLRRGMFLKGEHHELEIASAREAYAFECRTTPHPINAGSVLLDVTL